MDEKKVLIKVVGRQRYDDDEDDKIELTTIGTLEEAETEYILTYREELAPNSAPVKTRLSVQKGGKRIELLRSGDFSSLLIIERSKRNLCTYATEYGDLLMGIYGKSIDYEIGGDKGVISFGYDIDINGAVTSQNEVTIDFRINNRVD
ncbi:MAG: DUF1934 domain-containing protein [Eubacterium sp.]|nr:DUF1934 domain-containing protein [Eubacterium sp.]